MKELNLMKNVIIAIVGLLIAFFLLNRMKADAPSEMPVENVETQEMKFTSLKGVEIFLDFPQPQVQIDNPLLISGRAPGNWFFEASAPVVLTDWDGLIIAEGYVMAEGEWMTTDYVPFSGTLTFVRPAYGERGTFILKKDNPSGEARFDDAVEFMIRFK